MENIILIYIILINIIGFVYMYIDKKRSMNHKWRIKEKTLICIALVGGSIGSFVGMHIFRHKTKHIKFTIGIPIIILLQVFMLIYYFKQTF